MAILVLNEAGRGSEMIMRMLQGRQVVRLKGGCPSVFSRCSSELQALAAAGCAAELVPGVSSALAAPLFAGMPCQMTPLLPSSDVVRGTERTMNPLKHRVKLHHVRCGRDDGAVQVGCGAV